ncbi:DCC1-like thiol-disulfide oxidoreductase family protein [Desmospora activa]|uniref:Putative DCC family thiol-disulfide oxidoreductase YuxK n=1 Tax=Desmospora activa DSM 45169 TaxID=1121389 RepID=A0A2T4Z3R2_9BACL|nr:DCC1-like thiol-disulfide oxidoreductase family protein [Desmospora activa]PTM56496.1 putative DCC family thiol-disulfide oxidoreductase YuxK [Desmospora activa DSM 45169]
MIQQLERWLSHPHHLIGVALFRIFTGVGISFYLIYHWPERHLLWGDTGLWPREVYLAEAADRGIWTLFHLTESPWLLEAVYGGGLVVSFLFTIGLWTRPLSIAVFLVFWSLYYRNTNVPNGGDNLIRIQLFFLMFTQAGARLSVDAWLRRRSGKPPSPLSRMLRPYGALFHNLAVVAMVGQLLFLYFTAGIYKVMGSMWQEGTAVYYAMRVQDFVWPGVSKVIWASEGGIVFLTYSSVLFQIAFPFLLLNRWSKYAAILGALLFHAGVGLMMNLVLFSWYMIACEWLLLSDREYRWLKNTLSPLLPRKGGLTMKHGSSENNRPSAMSITVFYDGWCRFCTKSVTTASRLDWFGWIRFVSFREPGIIQQWNLDPEKVEKRLHSTADGIHFREGIDGIIHMVGRLPLLWPTLPFLQLAKILGLGQRLYDWIASRRTIIPTGGCDEHCEIRKPKDGA